MERCKDGNAKSGKVKMLEEGKVESFKVERWKVGNLESLSWKGGDVES